MPGGEGQVEGQGQVFWGWLPGTLDKNPLKIVEPSRGRGCPKTTVQVAPASKARRVRCQLMGPQTLLDPHPLTSMVCLLGKSVGSGPDGETPCTSAWVIDEQAAGWNRQTFKIQGGAIYSSNLISSLREG